MDQPAICEKNLIGFARKAIAQPPSARFDAEQIEQLATVAGRIDGLEIGELIGQGGMGVVFSARQTALARDVALKILPLTDQPELLSRFQREARSMAALRHPGIVGVYDHGVADGHPYLLLELVRGRSLRQVGPLPTSEVLPLIQALCAALAHAHEHGVVHRDIKPDNILIGEDGQPRIVDFGLVKLTGNSTLHPLTSPDAVMGTPHYMAPEQLQAPRTVDHRADIYAVGVLIYELLTGRLPIGNFASVADRRLQPIVMRALAQEPARRYATIRDLAAAIAAIKPPQPKNRPRRALCALALMMLFAWGASQPWSIGGAVELAQGVRYADQAVRFAGGILPDWALLAAVCTSLGLWAWRGPRSRAWLPALCAVAHAESLYFCLRVQGMAGPGLLVALSGSTLWLAALLVARHRATPIDQRRALSEPYLVMMALTTLLLVVAGLVLMLEAEPVVTLPDPSIVETREN